MPDVLTIREAVKRAKEEGYPISENCLRTWIRSGVVPVRKAGNKHLIYYPRIIDYLRCEDGGDNSPATVTAPGIRRIEAG